MGIKRELAKYKKIKIKTLILSQFVAFWKKNTHFVVFPDFRLFDEFCF